MDLLFKVGPKRFNSDFKQRVDWLDGQLVTYGPNGCFTGKAERKHFCVISTPHNFKDYDCLDLKSPNGLLLKKYLNPKVENYYKWDTFYKQDAVFADYLMRDWFVDFQWLLNQKLITKAQHLSIYDKSVDHLPIYIDGDFTRLFFNENDKSRQQPTATILPGTIDAGGTYTVGTSQTYSTWQVAVADLPADIGAMTTPGNIILQGNTDEELAATTANLVLSLDTDSYSLTLNAAAGVKHDGVYEGHRIQFGAYDNFDCDEVSANTLNQVIIQDLAFKATGANALCIDVGDGFTGSGDGLIVERIVADLNSTGRTMYHQSGSFNTVHKVIIRNNISYDADNERAHIYFSSTSYSDADNKIYIYNNTLINGGAAGIYYNNAIGAGTTFEIKNNLCEANATDYDPNGNGWTNITTSKNVSGDATSPDGATYQNWAGTANFTNYAGDDFTLGATDSTLDDGDDLSAVGSPQQFSDDMQEQSRSTWFCGASEYVSVGSSYPIARTIYGPLQGPLKGVV